MNARQRRTVLLLMPWVVVMGIAAPRSVAGQGTQESQIEKGRVAVTQVCVGCHGGGVMRMLEVRKKSAEEWRDTVLRMIGRGAQVFPDEIEPLTAYLAATAGRGRPQATSSEPGAGVDQSGGAILARHCQQCHDIARARTKPASANWRAIIDRMVALGASPTPAEQQALIDYLSRQDK